MSDSSTSTVTTFCTWTNDETEAAISIWASSDIQKRLKGKIRNRHVYQRLAEQLNEKGGFRRTWLQCREKLKKLRLEYQKLRQSGSAQDKGNFRFYEQFDAVLGQEMGSVAYPADEVGIDMSMKSSLLVKAEPGQLGMAPTTFAKCPPSRAFQPVPIPVAAELCKPQDKKYEQHLQLGRTIFKEDDNDDKPENRNPVNLERHSLCQSAFKDSIDKFVRYLQSRDQLFWEQEEKRRKLEEIRMRRADHMDRMMLSKMNKMLEKLESSTDKEKISSPT